MSHDGSLLQTYALPSGVEMCLFDATRHYFGGYYHVRLEAKADIPLHREYFRDSQLFEDALERLGVTVYFGRSLEKMAVHCDDIILVRNSLLEAFEATVLKYLRHQEFAKRFVGTEYAKCLSKRVPAPW